MRLPTHNNLSTSDLLKLDEFLRQNSGKKKEKRNLCWMDGYLLAVCSSPRVVMPSEWQTNLYPDVVFDSMEQANEILGLVMSFYNLTLKAIEDSSHIPMYDRTDFDPKETRNKSIKIWCDAYLDGVRLSNPELLKDNEVVMALTPIIAGSTIGSDELKKGDLDINDFVAKIPLATKSLCKIYKKHQKDYAPQLKRSPATKLDKLPNRNDPCLCGSGKKFKKCCLN